MYEAWVAFIRVAMVFSINHVVSQLCESVPIPMVIVKLVAQLCTVAISSTCSPS